MPRRPRVFLDGAIYHAYCRFGHGTRIFDNAGEARRLLAIVKDVARSDVLRA